MWKDFKAFLLRENALALAIAVVIGAALQKVVTALVQDIIMPFVGALTPGGEWRTAIVPVGPIKFAVGDLVGALVDFIIVAFVIWRLSKMFIRETPKDPTKHCAFCMMSMDARATRCPHCTSPVEGAVGGGLPSSAGQAARR